MNTEEIIEELEELSDLFAFWKKTMEDREDKEGVSYYAGLSEAYENSIKIIKKHKGEEE